MPGAAGTGGSPLPDDSLDTSRVDGGDTGRYAECQTGADANEDADCARVAVENSLFDFWSDTLEPQAGVSFTPEEELATFTGAVDTGCGQATSQVGPFYCPADRRHLSRHHVLRGRAPGPARRAGG